MIFPSPERGRVCAHFLPRCTMSVVERGFDVREHEIIQRTTKKRGGLMWSCDKTMPMATK